MEGAIDNPAVGSHVTYEWTNRKGFPHNVTGTVGRVETGHTLRNVETGDRFDALKLRIKPDDVSRAIRTGAVRATEKKKEQLND